MENKIEINKNLQTKKIIGTKKIKNQKNKAKKKQHIWLISIESKIERKNKNICKKNQEEKQNKNLRDENEKLINKENQHVFCCCRREGYKKEKLITNNCMPFFRQHAHHHVKEDKAVYPEIRWPCVFTRHKTLNVPPERKTTVGALNRRACSYPKLN